MRVDDPNIFVESSPTQIIEGVLGKLKLEGLESIYAPPETNENEEEAHELGTGEVPENEGHEEGACEEDAHEEVTLKVIQRA